MRFAAAWGALLLFVGTAAGAILPIYVHDAEGDHGAASLAAAYAFVASEDCVPEDGEVSVRICSNVTVPENVDADFTAKGISKLIVEGGYWIGEKSYVRQDQTITVTGGEGRFVSGKLPANATLEVRNLHFVSGISFDTELATATGGFLASRSVSVHNCRIDGGWTVPYPASGSYTFEDNRFEGHTAYAVSFYTTGAQLNKLAVTLLRNRIEGGSGLSTSKEGGKSVTLDLQDNTLVHQSTAEYDPGVWSLCACGGTAQGTVTISKNKMLGRFPVAEEGGTAPALLTVGAKGTLAATISENHISCSVAEAVVKGTTTDIGKDFGATGTELVHAYPTSTPDHSSKCHVCADCKQALVRVMAVHGTVEVDPVTVPNYVGTGTNVEQRTVYNVVKLNPGESQEVSFTSVGGEFQWLQLNGGAVTPTTSSTKACSYTVSNPATAPFTDCPQLVAMFKIPVVYSSNIHALVKVVSAATNTIINVPWMGYTQDGAPTLNLLVDRLVNPKNLTEGDFVLVHPDDASEKTYAAWRLTNASEKYGDETTNYKKWIPVATVARLETDGNGTTRSDVYVPTAEEAAAFKEIRGKGVWLLRQNPLNEDKTAKPFFLYGQWAKGSATLTIPGGTEDAPFCALLASPDYTGETEINKLNWTANGMPGAKDSLILTTDGKTTRYCTWVASKGKWRHALQTADKHGIVSTSYDYDLKVPAGTGFWYVRRTAGSLQLTFPGAPVSSTP